MQLKIFVLAVFSSLMGCSQFQAGKMVSVRISEDGAPSDGEQLVLSEFSKKIACRPTLVSKGLVLEKDFSDSLEVQYGPIRIVRTDIGEPDGYLKIFHNGRKICSIEVSLLDAVYLLLKHDLLLLEDFSGSSSSAKLYDLSQNCHSLGWIDTSGKTNYRSVLLQKPICAAYE